MVKKEKPDMSMLEVLKEIIGVLMVSLELRGKSNG